MSMDYAEVAIREHELRSEKVNRQAFQNYIRRPMRKFGYRDAVRGSSKQ